jgi:hypothetical protein
MQSAWMCHSVHSECGDMSIGVQACKTSEFMARCNVPYSMQLISVKIEQFHLT